MNNFLLEGEPGVGKTTLLYNIAKKISHLDIGGFYTKEIRENKKRVGFRIDTFSDRSGILSHINLNHGPRVGKYKVNVSEFEIIGVTELKRALLESRVILVDEIGKMELYSNQFKEIIMRCFDSPKILIATIMAHAHPFVDSLKKRPDIKLMRVTRENRDKLELALINEIRSPSFSKLALNRHSNW